MNFRKKKHGGSLGFTLTEVALAIGLIAFCMLTLMALLPVGIASDQHTIQQSAAANIAATVLADLDATSPGSVSSLFGLERPASGASSSISHTVFLDENGARTGNVDADALPAESPRYRVYVEFTAPAGSANTPAVPVRILVTWPALADPEVSNPPANFTGSFEVISAMKKW
ncbi:hypothetical protein DB346_24980 [Verrucomicrobia bacterium LW23]|nr:hypothetical protein DB346_24980 [Verrucomicrobia bacterium LW23]